ncbi:MAG: queuosine precursor transporter [Gammaproteobacteria bacterium]|nr:queuosine precursor transporter [Gammaproteobacteria bacterium]
MPNGTVVENSVEMFSLMYATTSGAVFASMMAYIAAQYCDVYMFHFWKRLTNGKHLWLRNNGSTLISRGVDSLMVISVTFGATFISGGITLGAMLVLMGSNYLFKMISALADTLPFYAGVHYLQRYLEISDEELRAHAIND